MRQTTARAPRHPGIAVEIVAKDGFVDVFASGCDAGMRYDERMGQDMIAIPISPCVQRFATAASSAHLDRHGHPAHPRDLLRHPCILGRFASGRLTSPWEFEREGEVVRIEPQARLTVGIGGATDLAVDAAIAGVGVVHLFEGWLEPLAALNASATLAPSPQPRRKHLSRAAGSCNHRFRSIRTRAMDQNTLSN